MQSGLPFPDLSPEIFTIHIGSFAFSLRWYALAYIAGLIAGWRIVVALMRRPGGGAGGGGRRGCWPGRGRTKRPQTGAGSGPSATSWRWAVSPTATSTRRWIRWGSGGS